MTRTSARPGFAAATALCMLAAVAGLAVASSYAAVEARRAANRAARSEQAASTADAGLRRALDAWNGPRWDSIPIGAVDSVVAAPADSDSTPAQVFVTRLTDHVYWLTAAGRAGAGSSVEANRAHGLLVEVLRPVVRARAALTSRGGVLAGRSTVILGEDALPPAWSDCPPADTSGAPAVVVPEGSVARYDDGGPIPGTWFDSLADAPATYQLLGRVDLARLATRADLVLVPGAILSPAPDTDTGCRLGGREAVTGSWGEPARTGGSPGCERYFPVVHAAGDLDVTGGRGQGVLIVSGRLRIQGPFLFAGVIFASGGIDVSGQDVRVYGAVVSSGAAGVTWQATGELRRSTCAIARVSNAAAKPYPVPQGWAELF